MSAPFDIKKIETEILSQIHSFVKPVISPFYKENVSKRFDKIKCFHTPTASHNYVTKINYSIRNPQRIFRGFASDLDRVSEQDSEGNVFYSYLIDRNGTVFGRVYDALEMGTSHQMLVDIENDPVYLAGEMKIQGDRLWFNFESGTFTKFLKLDEDPSSKEGLIRLLTELFGLYHYRENRFTKITYIDRILFPVEVAPSEKEIEHICTKYNAPRVYKVNLDGSTRCSQIKGQIKNVTIPENDICISSKSKNVNSNTHNSRNVKKKPIYKEEFTTKKEAETFYKVHPYEFVLIYSTRNRTWYWNENEANPYDFKPAPESAYQEYTE
jgi:hypothetical protein